MSSSKGQSANELLVIYMFVMLIFTVFILSFTQQRALEIQNARIKAADSLGEKFAYEINGAARAGNGYSRKIIYPIKLDGNTNYTIILNNLSKTVDVQFKIGATDYSHSFPVINTNFIVNPDIPVLLPNGTEYGKLLHSNSLNYSRGEIYIQNIDGAVLLSTVTYFISTPWSINVTADPMEIVLWGNSSNISAILRDQFGNSVPDGTLVHFRTDKGQITEFVPTVKGFANTSLVSGSEMGQATVNATVLIYGMQLTSYRRISFVTSRWGE